MPRIITSAADPVDYCYRHYPTTEAKGRAKWGHEGYAREGRDVGGFAYNADHAPYGNGDRCFYCGDPLTNRDN